MPTIEIWPLELSILQILDVGVIHFDRCGVKKVILNHLASKFLKSQTTGYKSDD